MTEQSRSEFRFVVSGVDGFGDRWSVETNSGDRADKAFLEMVKDLDEVQMVTNWNLEQD